MNPPKTPKNQSQDFCLSMERKRIIESSGLHSRYGKVAVINIMKAVEEQDKEFVRRLKERIKIVDKTYSFDLSFMYKEINALAGEKLTK